MNPEVIFIFVVLAIINSIFNKNKVQKKQQQRRNQQNQQGFGQSGPDQRKTQTQTKTQTKTRTQTQTKTHSRDSEDYGLSERRKEPSLENREKAQSKSQPERQRPRSLLEEVLEQYNIKEDKAPSIKEGEIAKDSPEKVEEISKEEGHYTDYSNRELPKKSRKKTEMKPYSKPRKKGLKPGELSGDFFEKSSVEKSEIGVEGFDQLLKFDQESLVQAIVMSEILDKPKAMRKKKVS